MSIIGEERKGKIWRYVVSLAQTLKLRQLSSPGVQHCGESPATYLKWHLNFCRRPVSCECRDIARSRHVRGSAPSARCLAR